MTTSGRPITPGSTVTPGDSVRPVNTGQEAQLEKTDQCLDQSEFSVLNSPGRSVQLEHNVHEQPEDIPNLQIEHLSEHSQVCQDLAISDSPDIRSDDSTERLRTHLQDSGFRSSGTGHTVNSLGTGHTCNRSDRGHSIRRSRSVRSDAMEHGSDRTRHRSHVSLSSRRDSHSIPLRHTDPGELSPASMIRHRLSRRCLALTTLSLRDVVVVLPLIREGRRRNHIRRGSTPLLVLLLAALPLIPQEKGNGTSQKRRRRNTPNLTRPNVTSVRRSTRGGGVLLHLLLLLCFFRALLLLLGEVQPGRSLE